MASKDSDLKNLIKEYHDGLLLYEISNRMVWDKAAKDDAGLAAYFKKTRKDIIGTNQDTRVWYTTSSRMKT